MNAMKYTRVRESFEKPSVWLVLVVGLSICSVSLLILHNDDWSSFGLAAVAMGVFGRLYTNGPMQGREKWFRRILLMISAFLFLPVFGHQLRTGPDGNPATMLGHIVATVIGLRKDMQQNLAQPPPLKGGIETKAELLGAIKTDFLNLTNMSEKGIFPTACNYFSGSEVHAITLPEVIKPYDTVLVELKTKQGKIHFTKGDWLEVECKDYGKTLTIEGH
jgi:hypothetical protein